MSLLERANVTPTVLVRRLARVHSWRGIAVDALVVLIPLAIAATFAYRPAPPGFRHDWLWPADRHVLMRWFVEYALSSWNPHGLGSSGQAASLDWVLAFFATLAFLGLSASSVLFVAFATLFISATFGVDYLLETLGSGTDRRVARMLGVAYALGPVCFQKAVAGHLLWLAAYAALPWFAACIWRGCRPRSGPAPFIAAALLYAVSSAQIQFLAFDALVMLTIVASHGPRLRPWLGVLLVLGTGLIHNADALLAPFGSPSDFAIGSFHGTREWEMDMSSPLPDLALFGGYVGYDRSAVPQGTTLLYRAGSVALVILSAFGLLRRPGRPTVVFSVIGLGALFFAGGWDGPFAALFDAALQRFVLFTIFRELFHAMALYALAIVVLAGFGCASLPRQFASFAAGIALLVALPFATGGLSRLVPSVGPSAGETESGFGMKSLRVTLPFPEPISETGLASGGSDPARMDDDVASTGNAPAFMPWLLNGDSSAQDQRRLAADVGIGEILWRERRVPFLPRSFEPGVGARFGAFSQQQKRMRERFHRPTLLAGVRTTVQLEDSPGLDPLQYFLADRELPPGRDVPFLSSFASNDVDNVWVTLHLWSWSVPNLSNVISDGVFTRSSAPLALSLYAKKGNIVYILGAGDSFILDGVRGEPSRPVALAYRWWRWHLNRPVGVLSVRAGGPSAIVRIRVSSGGNWHARLKPSGQASNAIPISAHFAWPWMVAGSLPPSRRMTLVFGRMFSSGWHMEVERQDLGPSHAVDAVFNGWTLPSAPSPRAFRLIYEPQRRASSLIAVAAVLEFGMLLALLASYRPRYSR